MSFEGSAMWMTGPVTLTLALMLNVFLAGFSHMTVTTRLTYALVRDRAIPGAEYLE